MTKYNFDDITEFLRAVNLTKESADLGIFILDISTITNEALTYFQTYRNNFYEINLVTEQTNFQFTIDGVTYKPSLKPYVCFVSPNQLQTFEVLDKDFTGKGFLIYIVKSELNSSFFENKNFTFFKRDHESFYELTDDQYAELNRIVIQLYKEFYTNQTHKKEILRHLLSILLLKSLSILGEQKSIITSKPNQITDRFVELIKQHFLTEKTVQFYAKRLALTTKTLTEIVKRTSSKTALQLIHEQIEIEAKYRLLHTSDSIKEISYQLGFEEISSFSRWFKKQVGSNPEKFRQSS
jgi:AraC family transcriptional regulator, transcriptional activator of pobA